MDFQTQENASKFLDLYKSYLSIDLYNIAIENNIENWKRRIILGILKDRKEDDLIYSIAINI